MDIDRSAGLQAFNDALKLAASWLPASVAASGIGETPLQFVTRQVTTTEVVDDTRIFRLYCVNSQNRGGARDLLDDRNWTALGQAVLRDYDYTYVANTYPCTDAGLVELCDDVLQADENGPPIIKGDIQRHLEKLRDPLHNKTAAWVKLLSTIQEGAALFCRVAKRHPTMALKNALAEPVPGDLAVEAVTLPALQRVVDGVRVKNVGVAIAFNFMKDLGNRHFFKPDVHTCAVVGYAFNKAGNAMPLNPPWEVIRKVLAFSHATGIPLAHIDRVMWLAGSGRFLGPVVAGGPWTERLHLNPHEADVRRREMGELFRKAVKQFD